MNKVYFSFLLCVLLVFSVIFVDAGRKTSRRKPSGGGSRRPPDKHQTPGPTGGFGGGTHGSSSGGTHGTGSQHFLDGERRADSSNRGHIGFEKYGNPSNTNPNPGGLGFGSAGSGSYKPSAPAAGSSGGIGSAFGGANYPPKTQNTHVQSAPYPTHNNPGGFGNAPAGGTHHNQPGSAFGTNPVGGTHNQPGVGFGNNPVGGTHYNQPGAGFGTNPVGGTHNQPGVGFGNNPVGGTHYNQPGAGFGNNPAGGTHYNQPGAGFGTNPGTHYNQPGAGFGANPAGGTHYNQGGFGQPGTHYGQPGYGGGVPGSHYPAGGNAFGGGQPNYPVGHAGGFGGHQPSYPGQHNSFGGGYPGGSYGGYPGGHAANPGGFGGYNAGYNPGGFGGGHSSFGHGGYPSGGFGGYPGGGGGFGGAFPGGYKQKSGPGFGTGILGGAAGALPLGLLLGYGLGSMGSHSTPFSSNNVNPQNVNPSNVSPNNNNNNNEAFNEWLKQRTEEKKQEIATNATIAAGGDPKSAASGQAPVAVNQTAIVNQILTETQMCPGGTGILDASFLNTLVPCNVTQVDFDVQNVTEPISDDCKSLTLDLVQVNKDTNENKTVSIRIKQNNVTGSNEFVILTYDIDFVSCVHPLNNPDGKSCETKAFTADPYHILNETLTYLHTTNITLTQYNTTLNLNNSCAQSGACGPDSKAPRNITSTFINFSILPKYPANIMMSQCMIFKTNTCDPTSTTPCETPLLTTLQKIHTNTSLSSSDFANINFVLHQSADIFLAYTPPPPPPPQPAAPEGAQPGSSSTLTGTSTTGSSATTI